MDDVKRQEKWPYFAVDNSPFRGLFTGSDHSDTYTASHTVLWYHNGSAWGTREAILSYFRNIWCEGSNESGSGSYRLRYSASSGVPLVTTPGVTTTILGSYQQDMKYIISELMIHKNTDFSGNPGGFNVLNTPDEFFEELGKDGFWEEYNKPFLDAAIERGDIFLMASPEKYMTDVNGRPTGYGREYRYLYGKGYRLVDGRMVLQSTVTGQGGGGFSGGGGGRRSSEGAGHGNGGVSGSFGGRR